MLRTIAIAGFSALARANSASILQSNRLCEDMCSQASSEQAQPCEIAPAPTAFDRRALLSRAPRLIIASRGRPRA